MSLELRTSGDGVIVRVRVSAGARESAIRGVHDGALKVAVRPVAEKGKANRAVMQLLAEALSLPGSQLQILSGLTKSQKTILVNGVTSEAVRERLSAFLES